MEDFPDIFLKIKPIFESVIKNPTRDSIISLNDHLKQVHPKSAKILQNVFLYQLLTLLSEESGVNCNELKTHVLDCITTVLLKEKLRKAIIVKTLLIACIKNIYDPNTGQIRPNLSEEYKLAHLRVTSSVMSRIHSELVEDVYVKDNRNLIAQAIFVCVSIVNTERWRVLRIQAVDAILSLLQVHDYFDSNDIVLRCQVAELLFVVLPKLMATFLIVVKGDDKQGVEMKCIAVKALGRTLCLIFEDYSKEGLEVEINVQRFRQLTENITANKANEKVLGLGLRQRDQKSKYFNEAVRSREWLLAAEEHVEKLLLSIQYLRGHEDDSIRFEFAKMNCELLKKCTYNMPRCTVHYLQSIIALCQDDTERIREMCRDCGNAVSSFTVSIEGNRIDELFYDALNQLPRSIYRGDSIEQIASFRLVGGYLHFFSTAQLMNVLSNQNILQQFIAILLAGAELDGVDELVRREYVSYRFEYEEGFRLQKEKNESRWIVLKNVTSPRARRCFLDVFQALQHHTECLNTVCIHILQDFFTSRVNSNGYLYILSEMIPRGKDYEASSAHNDLQEKLAMQETFKNILLEVMQPHHWLLELDENDNIIEQKYNILHICLVLRIVTRMASTMGNSFQPFLYDALRLMLQCASSMLNCINESSELALDTIATALGLSGIQQLIYQNLDYISHHITRCMRRTEHFQDGLRMLESVLRFVPYESSNVLESTVTPIVMNILDSYSQYGQQNSIVCLRVLQIFIHSMRFRFNHESSEPLTTSEESDRQKLSEQIKRLQSLLQREISNEPDPLEADLGQMEQEETGESRAAEEDDVYQTTKTDIPSHLQLVLRILSVNFKFVASSNEAERIVALSTINEGIHIVHRHENQLLPLVHNIWFNLTERFTDKSPAVLSNALDLLVTLAKLAKDFIRKRSIDDVLPKLYLFMKNNWDADFSAHQVFKMQRKFLLSLPDLVKDLALNERQLDEALEVVRLYLEKCERKELKKHAWDCIQRLKCVNSFAVFLKVQ
ncbi:TELO2-interacting protein 1 homolog [Anopheles cruzii]|uniref:TELO2-interacting protein 1 homolog n=1 Tax=Anopheles cruzii TaxID=68878 RepID=UPI0022EC6966|nr:TELO2-interacting protein 1 homolog [Anopheles cruzii]